MIHPDVAGDWYNAAKLVMGHKPEATLWDLFRYKMMWEHGEDIDEIVEVGFEICSECTEKKEIHAKGRCYTCYVRIRRREKKNEVK